MKLLKEGDIIEIKKGHTVYADIPEHFVYINKRGSFKLTNTDVYIYDEFLYLTGEYIVIKTSCEGGGTGHGPLDVYPDGHRVYCVKSDDTQKINFYQTGAFTAMIKDIEPIGRAKLTWVKE